MRKSSIGSLATSLLLVWFVSPLRSDPQRGYWSNYARHGAPVQRFHPTEAFPDRYTGPPTVHGPPSNEGKFFTAYESRYLENQRTTSKVPETKFLRGEAYYDYRDFIPAKRANRGRENLQEDRAVFDRAEDAESNSKEEEIAKRMSILDKMLSDDSREKDASGNIVEDKIMSEETKRVARQIRKQRPGFFWTLARITFETFNDTKSAIQRISDLINNSIVPDSATQSSMTSSSLTAAETTTPASNATETTTTQAPFVLTRSRVQSLIRRNVLGLVRLFNLEWRDAWNQSETNVREFQRDLGTQVGAFLRDNPNAY